MKNRLPEPTPHDSGSGRGSSEHARIFKPVEHALLAEYFRMPGLLPEWAGGVDLGEFPLDDWDESEGGIAPLGSVGDRNVLENAVARIALAPIQEQLPQWAAYDSQQVIPARTIRQCPERDATSRPLLLFGINWATSGPGFSWPEEYHVTWIPHYDRYIVTASSDSKDVHGFEDIALGFFRGSPVKGGDRKTIKSIITGYWTETSDVQMAWEEYWNHGAISNETAWKWRGDVWSENGEDEDETDRIHPIP
jgi:hypothetical protein